LEKKSKAVKILALSATPSSGLRKGNVVDIKEAAKALKTSIRQTEKTIGFPIRSAYISIGGVSLSSVVSKGMTAISRADGEITDYDVKRVIAASESNLARMANKRIIHVIPLSYKIDNETVGKNPVGMKGGKLEVETMFVLVFTQNLNNLIKSVELTGLKIEDIIASPVALSRILLDKRQKEAGALIFDMGAATTSVAIFEEGIPISVNVFPFGSGNITNDIALVLQISLDEAEKLRNLCRAKYAKSRIEVEQSINKRFGK